MRDVRVLGLLAATAALGGCILEPFGLRVRRLRSQVDGITARVDELEREAFLTGGASPAGAGGGSATLITPIPAEEGFASVATPELGGALPTVPQPGASQWPFPQVPWGKAFTKLARGIVNVLTGWVEIPKQVDETTTASGAGVGWTFGTLKGLAYGFVRTAGGIYEVITFPFPAPPHYAPVTRPKYVFTCEGSQAASDCPPGRQAEMGSAAQDLEYGDD
jgi:putative exosortase-associated protein (TIGR04073 family)